MHSWNNKKSYKQKEKIKITSLFEIKEKSDTFEFLM
jgi:hypothetical protein